MTLNFLKITVKPGKHINREVFPPQTKTKARFQSKRQLGVDVSLDGALPPPFLSLSPNSGEFPDAISLYVILSLFSSRLIAKIVWSSIGSFLVLSNAHYFTFVLD